VDDADTLAGEEGDELLVGAFCGEAGAAERLGYVQEAMAVRAGGHDLFEGGRGDGHAQQFAGAEDGPMAALQAAVAGGRGVRGEWGAHPQAEADGGGGGEDEDGGDE